MEKCEAMGLLFGKAFCVVRMKRDLAQAEVARRAGMDASYLAAIENGRRKAPSDRLMRGLLNAVEVTSFEQRRLVHLATLDRLVESLDNDATPDHPATVMRSLLNQMAELGEVELRCVATVVDSLARDRAKRMEDYL
jgi:transcriptional regulator with XRE-family HTH domain